MDRINDECPERGAGLGHMFDDGAPCVHCGVGRYDQARPWINVAEWFRAIGQPRAVVLAGETIKPKDDRIGDFAALNAREWHALTVERHYWERHGLDRGEDCDARPDH